MATNTEKMAAAQALLAKNKKKSKKERVPFHAPKIKLPSKTTTKTGRTGANTVKNGIETFTKPGHKGWKIDTGPPQKKTTPKFNKSIHPQNVSQRNVAPVGGRSPMKKVTFNFGKDKKGKPIGQQTIVDLGLNPSKALQAKGVSALRKQARFQGIKIPKRKGPEPKAKIPTRPDWYDKPAVEAPKAPKAPKKDSKSFSAGGINTALKIAGTVAVASVAAGVFANKLIPKVKEEKIERRSAPRRKVNPQARRNKAGALTAAATRKSSIPPRAPSVKIYKTSKPAHQKPKAAFEAAERADQRTKAKSRFQPPELKIETPVDTVEAKPEAAKPAKPIVKKRGSLGRLWDSRTEKTVEIAKERDAAKSTRVAVPEAEPKAKTSRTRKVTGTVKMVAKSVKQGIANVKDPVAAAEVRAAQKTRAPAVTTPVDTAPTEKQLKKEIAKEKRIAAKREKKAKKAQAKGKAPAAPTAPAAPAPKPAPKAAPATIVTPVSAPAQTAASVESAQKQINKAAKEIITPVDQKPERRDINRRVEPRRQQSDRFTKTEAKEIALTEGWERGAAPQSSSRRKRGSDPRGTGKPAIVTPVTPAAPKASVTQADDQAAARERARLKKDNQPKVDEEKRQTQRRQTPRTAGSGGRRAGDPVIKTPVDTTPKATNEAAETVRLTKEIEVEKKKGAALRKTRGSTRGQLSSRSNREFWKQKNKQIEAGQNEVKLEGIIGPDSEGATKATTKVDPKGRTTTVRTQTGKEGTPYQEGIAKEGLLEAKIETEEREAQKRRSQGQYHERGTGVGVEPADVKRNTLVEDVAGFKGKRIIQAKLNNQGEFDLTVTEGPELEQSKEEARRALEPRRIKERRDNKTRLSQKEAEVVVEGRPAARKVSPPRRGRTDRRGTTKPVTTPITPVHLPETDLQAREEWIAPDVAKEVEGLRPGGLPERRGDTYLDQLNQEELKDLRERAGRGIPGAEKLHKTVKAEFRGKYVHGRRPGETNAGTALIQRDLGTQIRELELEGKPKAPLAVTATPGPRMLKEGALPPLEAVKAEQREGTRGATTIPDKERRRHKVILEGGKNVPHPDQKRFPGMSRNVGGEPVSLVQANRRSRTDKRESAVDRRKEPRTLEERRKFTAKLSSGDQRTKVRDPKATQPDRRRPQITRGEERRAPGQVVPRQGTTTYHPVKPEATPATAVEHARGTNWSRAIGTLVQETGARFKRYGNIVSQAAKKGTSGPMIELAAETGKAQGRQVVGKKPSSAAKIAKTGAKFGAPVAVLAGLFGVAEGAKAASTTQGSQREKIKAAQETALDVGMDTGVGVTEFSVATLAARAAGVGGKPFLFAAEKAMPIAAMAYTALEVGKVAGKTKHAWDSQVQKEISEKAVMEAKYGTVERATQTRRNRNRKLSLEDAGVMLDRQKAEVKAKRDKRIKDARKVGRRPRGV
jgi:hypothetical protein